MVLAGGLFLVSPLSVWVTQVSVASTLGHSKNNQTAVPATTYSVPSLFRMSERAPKIQKIGPINLASLRKLPMQFPKFIFPNRRF